MNKKLFKNIKRFYKQYNTQPHMSFTTEDMYDYNTLMSAYEAIWLTLEDYDDHKACGFLVGLYNQLGSYIDSFNDDQPTCRKSQLSIATIIKIAAFIFGNINIGIFTVAMLEYGCCFETIGGLLLALFVAITSGVAAYQDIKEGLF